jgi:hypothetical protein
MQFASSVDGCRLLSQTSNDVMKLIRQQLEQINTIQALESETPSNFEIGSTTKARNPDQY